MGNNKLYQWLYSLDTDKLTRYRVNIELIEPDRVETEFEVLKVDNENCIRIFSYSNDPYHAIELFRNHISRAYEKIFNYKKRKNSMKLIDADELKEKLIRCGLNKQAYDIIDREISYLTPVNAISIPKGAANGDIFTTMFQNLETVKQGRICPSPTIDSDIPIDGMITSGGEIKCSIQADSDWWDAPYQLPLEKEIEGASEERE